MVRIDIVVKTLQDPTAVSASQEFTKASRFYPLGTINVCRNVFATHLIVEISQSGPTDQHCHPKSQKVSIMHVMWSQPQASKIQANSFKQLFKLNIQVSLKQDQSGIYDPQFPSI